MHGFINKPNVINEQYIEIRKVFAKSLAKDLVKGLEKSNSKKFDELSKILGRSTDETLLSAFNRMLTTAIRTDGREGGAKVLQFCRELSLINDQFAEEYMVQQIEVINKIRQSPKYSDQWESLVKINYGEKVLEKNILLSKGTSLEYLEFEAIIPKGLYNLVIKSNENIIEKSFIISNK